MTHPKISVIICAYTEARWDQTLAAIESVHLQTLKALEVLVVVDHNPRLQERLVRQELGPDVRILANAEEKGLAGGRNTGIAAAKGELLAFLDDDAYADAGWLAGLAGAMQDRPEVLAAFSRVDPLWIGTKPGWFPDEFLWTVGCSFRGQPSVGRAVRNGMGGAMCARKRLFDCVGGFSFRLGRQGTTLPLSGEEAELCLRARNMIPDAVFWYEPSAFIQHRVTAERLTWKYLINRCFAEGLSKAIVAQMSGKSSLGAEWKHTTLILPSGISRGLVDTVFKFDPSGVQRSAAIMVGFGAAACGFLYAHRKLLHSPKTPASHPAE